MPLFYVLNFMQPLFLRNSIAELRNSIAFFYVPDIKGHDIFLK
ncbi:hypothetical protein NIES2104_51240 [Leptolyngbya sp. NIES-2104]|nr:hypothetical protein NIES2104_51240 [Leptolyngbya sp. NIES-2104]